MSFYSAMQFNQINYDLEITLIQLPLTRKIQQNIPSSGLPNFNPETVTEYSTQGAVKSYMI